MVNNVENSVHFTTLLQVILFCKRGREQFLNRPHMIGHARCATPPLPRQPSDAAPPL